MLNFADLRGARGPMLYDTFQSGTVGSFSNWTGPVDGMSAQVCATTFRSTCTAMTASNVVAVSSTAGASAWNITLDDGWVARVDQSAGEIVSNNGSPMLVPMVRVIPAPVRIVLPCKSHSVTCMIGIKGERYPVDGGLCYRSCTMERDGRKRRGAQHSSHQQCNCRYVC
jgi:hypothetical protein